MHIVSRILASVFLLCTLNGCFTGVENTPRITEKDVSRAMSEMERRQPTMTLSVFKDSIPNWKVGKKFFVSDNQVRMLLSASADVDVDKMDLAGNNLVYNGYDIVTGLDNRNVVDIKFLYQDQTFVFHTGKPLNELNSAYTIPLLVDMDLVAHVARQIQDKDVYIKTPIWYDLKGEYMIHGRQYIKVHIDSVLPGNKVLPLKVVFTSSDNAQQAFVWMATESASINKRDYDSMFSAKDLHENYPHISDEHWKLIIQGDVVTDMTKEECRLAKGAPKSINRAPNQSEVREFWYYDGGSYLQFVDGLLKNYRK